MATKWLILRQRSKGEVTSASDLGVLSAAKGVAVTDGGALTLSVAEYNAITSSSRPLTATHKIADTAAAIEAAVGTGTALSGASSIDVQSGVVDLSLGQFSSLGQKFTDKGDISITEAAKASTLRQVLILAASSQSKLLPLRTTPISRTLFKILAPTKLI